MGGRDLPRIFVKTFLGLGKKESQSLSLMVSYGAGSAFRQKLVSLLLHPQTRKDEKLAETPGSIAYGISPSQSGSQFCLNSRDAASLRYTQAARSLAAAIGSAKVGRHVDSRVELSDDWRQRPAETG